MPMEMLPNCFIYGLKKGIQHELFILKQHSLSHTIDLAKLLEAKFTALKPSQPKFLRPAPPTSNPNTTQTAIPIQPCCLTPQENV